MPIEVGTQGNRVTISDDAGNSTPLTLSTAGTVTAQNAQATTAGGGAACLVMGAGGIGLYFGSGAPSISAAKGSLYVNTTGSSSSTRLYVNNGTTTWVAVTTAS
jgi:hypothetical protein